jgi:hypothetical protein
LSQQALIIDVVAKVPADNVAAPRCLAAQTDADLPTSRRCQRIHASLVVQRIRTCCSPSATCSCASTAYGRSTLARAAEALPADLGPGQIVKSDRIVDLPARGARL